MLTVSNLTRPGLQPVSFAVEAGKALAIVGPSGAGKSLLLRAIADLDPNDGDVSIDGIERRSVPAPRWRQMAGLLPAETGWWADTVGAHFTSGKPDEASLGQLGLPGDALDWQVARLSTGERQRLGLLRMLMVQPSVLLLDEPTASLDEQSSAQVEQLLGDRLAAGNTIVFASHDERQVARLAYAVMSIRDGVAEPPEAVP